MVIYNGKIMCNAPFVRGIKRKTMNKQTTTHKFCGTWMRNKCRYLGALSMFFLLFACSGKLELDELDPVDMNSTQLVVPSPGATIIDSLRSAFSNALTIAGQEFSNIDLFFYIKEDPDINAVVQCRFTPGEFPVEVSFHPSLIREYTWKGYQLIALHEWYHIAGLPPGSQNKDAHELMINDPLYHGWIKELFGCSDDEAKWLSYLGLENTPIYEQLSISEKESIAACAKKYNIKHGKKN